MIELTKPIIVKYDDNCSKRDVVVIAICQYTGGLHSTPTLVFIGYPLKGKGDFGSMYIGDCTFLRFATKTDLARK